MRLTPLGKTLVFLIGAGLVATGVYLYGPKLREQAKEMRGKQETERARPAQEAERKPGERATPDDRGPRGLAERPVDAGPWVAISAGLFDSGPEQVAVEVPAFRIHRTEVTNGGYQTFLDDCPVGSQCGPRALPSYWDDASYLETHRDYPVVFVTWGEASAYCRWAQGRLPTVAEWEKAARGTDGRNFPTGAALDPSHVNILGAEHDQKLRAPKQIPTWAVTDSRYARDASPFGVLGMGGNVSEWTSTASEEEPDLRLAAGGSWDSWDLSDARVYHRLPKNPADRSSSLGFRCAAGAS